MRRPHRPKRGESALQKGLQFAKSGAARRPPRQLEHAEDERLAHDPFQITSDQMDQLDLLPAALRVADFTVSPGVVRHRNPAIGQTASHGQVEAPRQQVQIERIGEGGQRRRRQPAQHGRQHPAHITIAPTHVFRPVQIGKKKLGRGGIVRVLAQAAKTLGQAPALPLLQTLQSRRRHGTAAFGQVGLAQCFEQRGESVAQRFGAHRRYFSRATVGTATRCCSHRGSDGTMRRSFRPPL